MAENGQQRTLRNETITDEMNEPIIIDFWCTYGGKHPIIGDVWYRCAGARGSDAERYDRYMCAAITMLVHTPSKCDDVVALIDAVASGNVEQHDYQLNDTCITFRKSGAQVDILIEDETGIPEGRFSLEECRKFVSSWKDFLKMPENEESQLRLVLP